MNNSSSDLLTSPQSIQAILDLIERQTPGFLNDILNTRPARLPLWAEKG